MEQQVLVFAGVKQSHKSTSAKYVTASRMRRNGIIKFFDINDKGDLIVSTTVKTENGFEEGRGVLDLKRTDDDFASYAYTKIWPFAKIYSFAEELKLSTIRIFGIDSKCVFGTDEDKEKFTHVEWKNLDFIPKKDRKGKGEFLTYRELLQQFGSFCRKFDENCWIKTCWNKIEDEGWPYCIIDDCRYENEVDYSTARGAKIVLLTHQPFKDEHSSEKIHSVDRSKFHRILDNANMSFEEKNRELDKILVEFGWETGEIS